MSSKPSPILDQPKRGKAKREQVSAPALAAVAAVQPNASGTKVVTRVAANRAAKAGPTTGKAAPATAAPAADAAPRRRRSNRRSEQTIENILAATEQVVLASGAERISILEVCETAGISRGTFYRYFASQDELLDAFSRHKRDRFHRSLAEVLAPINDPDERFDRLVQHLDDYLSRGTPHKLLAVAPEFALAFFKRIFHDAVLRWQDLLAKSFDAWDERLGIQIDRELVCEMMVRYMMSDHLIGGSADRTAMPRRIARMVDALRFGSARARR